MSTLAEQMASLNVAPAQTPPSTLAEQMASLNVAPAQTPDAGVGAEVAAKYKELFTPEPTAAQAIGDVGARLFETPEALINLPQTLATLPSTIAEGMGAYPEGSTQRFSDKTFGSPITEKIGLGPFFDQMTTPMVNREENPKTRAVGTALSWGAGAPISKLSKASTLPDLAMGAGAAGGEYLFGKEGEAGGGVLGFLGAALRGKLKAPTMDKPSVQAERLMTTMLADTPDAQAKITKALEDGVSGTVADLAESPNMYSVEKTLSSDPAQSALRGDIAKAVTQSEADTVKQLDELIPSASVEPAQLAAQKQLDEARLALDADKTAQGDKLTAGVNAQIDTAKALESQMGRELSDSKDLVASLRANADAAQGTVAGAKTPVNASRSIFDEYNILDENMSIPMREAYKVIDDAAPINAGKAVAKMDVDKAGLNLAATDADNYTKAYKEHLDKIESWKTSAVEPKEITAVVRNMKQQIADSSEGGIRKLSRKDAIANDMVKTLETHLDDPINVDGFKGFGNATALARDKFDAVTPETVGTARKNNVAETFTDTLSYSGKAGAQTARLADRAKDPAVLQGHKDVIAAAAKEKGMFGGKGVDDAFMKQYSGFLGEFPKEQAKYQAMADANNTAASAATEGAKTQTALTKAVAKSQKSTDVSRQGLTQSLKRLDDITETAKGNAGNGVVSQFGAEPKFTVGAAMSAKKEVENTKKLSDLNAWAKNEGVEPAFKGQVKDELMGRLFPESGTGLRQATGASAKAFKATKQRLIDSKIMTQDEADAVTKALETNAGRQAARQAAGMTEVSPKLTPEQKQMAAAAAVVAVTTTGIPHALFAIGFTRRMIEQSMVNMKMSAAGKDKMAEFMTNPEKYRKAHDLMKKINADKRKPTPDTMANVVRAVVGTTNTTKQDEEE